MLSFIYIYEWTYNISPAMELNSSIFSFVIILRASWSFDSTTGSAVRMINEIKSKHNYKLWYANMTKQFDMVRY